MTTSGFRLTESIPGILLLELVRPESRNALDGALISGLKKFFEKDVPKRRDLRAVVLSGEGKIFCAGGDLNWMKNSATLKGKKNLQDALELAHLLRAMNQCPVPLIGAVQGAAMGGGVGMAAVCDAVVSVAGTVFSLSELKLGLIPACIAPYVIAKIGETHARRYFLTAERFDAVRAKEIGLVQEVVGDEAAMRAQIDAWINAILQTGPAASRKAKALIKKLKNTSSDPSLYVATELAKIRVTPEAQEGIKAFFEKRPATWAKQGSST